MYQSKIIMIIFIFITVWTSLIYIGKVIAHDDISGGSILLQAIGIVGIIAYFL